MSRMLYLLAVPFLTTVSLTLASFAAFTTTLAFLTLLVRVSVIYVELGLALLQSGLSSLSFHNPPSSRTSPSLSPKAQAKQQRHNHHRHLRNSLSLSTSSLDSDTSSSPPRASASTTSLYNYTTTLPSTRDYEGVGGWRLTNSNDDEEALWMSMNSRLELPAHSIPGTPTSVRKSSHHKRSLTGGSQRGSIGFETSPGLVRHANGGMGTASPEGYFGHSLSGWVESPSMVSLGKIGEEGALGEAKGGVSTWSSRHGSRRSSVSLVRKTALD